MSCLVWFIRFKQQESDYFVTLQIPQNVAHQPATLLFTD